MERRHKFIAMFLERERVMRALEAAALTGADVETFTRDLMNDPALYQHRNFSNLSQAVLYLKGMILAGDRVWCGQGQVLLLEEPVTPCLDCRCGGQWISQIALCDDLGVLLLKKFECPCLREALLRIAA